MKKRLLCGFLAAITLFSVSLPAGAVSLNDREDIGGESAEDIAVDKYTINFDMPMQLANGEMTASEEAAVVAAHNQAATVEAKEYVRDLNLQDAGLEFIETSCLNELDRLAECDDFVLTSYTVRVPAGALSSNKSVPFEDLSYYGEYAGIDFYYYYYSEASGTRSYEKTTSKARQWFQNLVDLILCFADAEITVPITLVKQEMGNPYGYVPNTKAYCKYGFNVNIETRGIYTKYTTLLPTPHTTYEEVSSGQIGHLYPGIIYFPVQSPEYDYSYSIDLGYKGAVYTPYYKDKDRQLKDAFNGLNGAYIHRKVMDYPSSYYWG